MGHSTTMSKGDIAKSIEVNANPYVYMWFLCRGATLHGIGRQCDAGGAPVVL